MEFPERLFPHLFASSYKSNIANASLWWCNRSAYTELGDDRSRLGSMSGRARRERMWHNVKVLRGRGKRAPRVAALHKELVSEFERVKAASLKTSPEFLRHIFISLIQRATPTSAFAPTVRVNGVDIVSKITTRWIQEFLESHGLVIRRQTVKLVVSPEKQLYIKKSIAFHLGQLKRGFERGELDEDLMRMPTRHIL